MKQNPKQQLGRSARTAACAALIGAIAVGGAGTVFEPAPRP